MAEDANVVSNDEFYKQILRITIKELKPSELYTKWRVFL